LSEGESPVRRPSSIQIEFFALVILMLVTLAMCTLDAL